jgi:GH35 family endo-1,4-beta-xylanase
MKQFSTFLALMLLVLISTSNSLTASASNTLPSAVITAPHSNAYFQAGADVTINVYSTDFGGTFEDGTVEKVEFFIDGELVNETSEHNNHTYSYILTNVQEGEYRITARATDNAGDTFTSSGVLFTVGQEPVISLGMSAGKGKYLGNILASQNVRSDYLEYWNGVTAENAHKWGSIEGTRDQMNWWQADGIYNVAEDNHLMFRYHAIAWGSQYPRWIENLEPAEFQAEIEEYMAAIADRYPYMDQIDVLNENMHLNTWNDQEHAAGTPYFREGLGGVGETGYDWVIWLFQKARHYFPNSKLVMNDFELENNPDGIYEMLDVVEILRDRGLIDGFGTQAHTFNVDVMWDQTETLKERIDLMASSGVPVYVTELDLTGQPASEANQLRSYKNVFPVFWEHPAVGGITLWGYVEGSTWKEGSGIINQNGTKRSALVWLEEYMESLPDAGYPFQGIEIEEDSNMVSNGEFDLNTTGWNMQNNAEASSNIEVVNDAAMSGNNALRICPENAGTNHWHIQLRQLTPISSAKKYSISFMAKAAEDRTMSVAVQEDGDSYTTHMEEEVSLTTEPQEFSFEFTSSVDDPIATLKFYIGNNPNCVFIDNVEMYETDAEQSDVDEISKQDRFKVYPNPFKNNFTVSSNLATDNGKYQLMNSSGQVLRKGVFNHQKTIETTDLNNGFYILQIESGLQTESFKLIKK